LIAVAKSPAGILPCLSRARRGFRGFYAAPLKVRFGAETVALKGPVEHVFIG